MTEEPQKQYWLDLVGYMTRGGMAVAPLETIRSEGTEIDDSALRMMAELLIPYHAPDGKKYGFTVYILNKPNYVPAFEEMRALLAMAPEMIERFGALCREVLVRFGIIYFYFLLFGYPMKNSPTRGNDGV
jgi:hypothetical protein